MHRLLIFRIVLIALVTTACSSTAGDPSVTTAQPVASTIATPTTEVPTTTEAPITTTTAADAAPPEMEGVWRTDLGNNDRVQLNLRGNDYIITRGPNSGSGDISVDGDLITFSGSTLCSGVGTYQWTVEGDSLTFTADDSGDPCSGRRPVLDGVTYTR